MKPPRLRARSLLSVHAAALLCLLAGIGREALADPPSSVQVAIDTRKAGFKKMGAAMKALVDQLKTEAPESAKLAAASQAIATSAVEVPHWFPAGTDNATGLDTDALPNIWKDRGRFDSLASQLDTESKTLTETVAGGDLAMLRAQANIVVGTCKSCHSSFRAD